MKNSNTRKTSRLWVGVKSSARSVFRYVGTPTAETHPQFAAAIGPFRTRRGAEYMAASRNGTCCQCVRDAEELAAIYAGQTELCAGYSTHLEKAQRCA